jgi:hypothetical protein
MPVLKPLPLLGFESMQGAIESFGIMPYLPFESLLSRAGSLWSSKEDS